MKVLCTLLLLGSLFLMGCATNPVTGRSEFQMISETEEISIGSQQYPLQIQMSGGPYVLDPELSDYVNRVGQSLA
ncbi:MAG: peptidase M48, partial [Kiritimatiellia bacterium]